MWNSTFVDVKVSISGKTQNIKMEKGCSFTNNGGVYTVGDNGKLSVFDKSSGKTKTTDTIQMNNHQMQTFMAVANNKDEKTGKPTLSIDDIKIAMNQFKTGKLTQDLSEFLKGDYKVKNPKLFSHENKISAYITNGNSKTSSVLCFEFNNNKETKPEQVTPVADTNTSGLFSNKNIIEQKAFRHTVQSGEDILSLAKKYELDTYQIIAANPQLKEGKDYSYKFKKGNLSVLKSRLKTGSTITIPARYKVKPGSAKNLEDVAKLTGISKGYLEDLLTVTEVHPSHPGKPDLTTYDDGFGMPTIGFGHTGRVDGKPLSLKHKIHISKAKAYEILAEDILKHEAMVISLLGKDNYNKAPASVKAAILDVAYNKGIIDGFLNPNHNKHTSKIKTNLQKGEYASALCNTLRPSASKELSRRNVYRFISGLTDLPAQKRKRAMNTFESYYKSVLKRQKGLDRTYLQTAWNNAKNGKTTGYRMKFAQKDR